MTLEKRFRFFLLLAAVVSLAGYGAAERSLGLLVLVLVTSVAGWWVTEVKGTSEGWKGLPRWLSSVILVVMLLVAVLRAMQGKNEVVSAFTGFLASIIVIKLWEKRQLRDYAQILTMSVFMTVGAALTDNSLAIGLLMIIQLPVFVVTVMLFQMYAANERARGMRWSGGAAEPVAMGAGPAWRGAGRAFARASAVSIVAGAGISVAVFLLVPRGIGLQEWGDFARPNGAATTGFTEEVAPGADEVIKTSQLTVMDVWFKSADGSRIGGPDLQYYLRGAVLDHYNASKGKWTKSVALEGPGFDNIVPAAKGQTVTLIKGQPSGRVVSQHIEVREGIKGETPVFALFRPCNITLSTVEQAQDITYDAATGWVCRHGDGSRVAYEVMSVMDPQTPDVSERAPNVTFPSEKIHDLASQVLKQSRFEPDPAKRPVTDDAAAARELENYMRRTYEYTLQPGPVPIGMDPTEHFLFTSKKGHCEYFASALAAMCRSVGIDARVVAGYLVNEYNSEHRMYTVRASDAHAWVEVNTGPGGWQRRDATPAEGLRELQGLHLSLLARLERLATSVQDVWNSTIVAYDQSSQERLLGQGDAQRGVMERGLDRLRRTIARLGRQGMTGAWPGRIMLAGAGFLVAGMAWVAWRAWRRRSRAAALWNPGWAMVGPERRAYADLLSVMAQRGYPKPGWLPPMQHLKGVAAQDATFAGAAGEVVVLLYRARFGGGNGEDLAAARSRLSALRDTHQKMNGNQ